MQKENLDFQKDVIEASYKYPIVVDKTLDDDGPRKACVAAFNVLGQQHELTRKHHRAFTSALF